MNRKQYFISLMVITSCFALNAMKQEPPYETTKELYNESCQHLSIRPIVDAVHSPDRVLLSRDTEDRDRLHQQQEQPAIGYAAQNSLPISVPLDEMISFAKEDEEDWSDDIPVNPENIFHFNLSGEALSSEIACFSDISEEEIDEQPESAPMHTDVDLEKLAKRDCSICWENMGNSEIRAIVTTCCSNMFHAACLQPCTTCPFCKKKLPR